MVRCVSLSVIRIYIGAGLVVQLFLCLIVLYVRI